MCINLLLQVAVEQHFKEKFHVIFGRLATPGKHPTDDDMRSLMFGDYLISSREAIKSYYDEIKDLTELREVSYFTYFTFIICTDSPVAMY